MFVKAAAISAILGGVAGFALGSVATLIVEHTASIELINFFEP